MDTHKKGFTIIELLVVITIVGMLLAVLLPAMGKAREGARRAQCLSNLRQISMAFYLYLDDHGEQFPVGGGGGFLSVNRKWEESLYPAYIDDDNVFICRTPEKVNDYTEEEGYEVVGIELNGKYYGYNGYLSSLSAVLTPSATILCADAASNDEVRSIIASAYFTISGRHSNGANIIFVSGNACWFPTEVIDENINQEDGGWWGSPPAAEEIPLFPSF